MSRAASDIIRFENVSRCFSTPARGDVWALRDFDLACRAGELTCVVGPSGCGKTTLLRLAAGLDTPTNGRVLVDGRAATDPSLRDIGMVSQEGGLFPWRRVVDNVALGLELRGTGRAERKARARKLLERLHLPPGIERSFPDELSGGMRQRVALARTLCPNPSILLMDEPFASLDEPTRHDLQRELLTLWKGDGQTILFVTHSIEEAVFLADRVVVMTFAQAVADIPVEIPRPRDRLADDFVATLLKVRRAFTEHVDETAPRSGK